MADISEKLLQVRAQAIESLHDNEERCVYHTIGWFHRVEKYLHTISKAEGLAEEEGHLVDLAFYIYAVHQATNKIKGLDFDKIESKILSLSDKISDQYDLSVDIKNAVREVCRETIITNQVTRIESKVSRDAIAMEFASPKGRDYLKMLYEEMMLRDFDMPQSNWYDNLISFISDMVTYTSYGKEHIDPQLAKLGKKLKKERKDLENRRTLLLKKELNISESELKKLKKDIDKAKNRDERGIQTLFRTTIKNHYTLNEMVDRKASIMITVNSIILSLVMSGIIGNEDGTGYRLIPVLLLSLTCISSIIFAVLAIRPLKTQGDFTEEEIRNKEGNLLYFGNFHNMHFRDFEWGFLQMLSDKNYLYGSMVRDFYYQGVGLYRKYWHIRLSLTIFLFGFGASFVSFVIVRMLYIS